MWLQNNLLRCVSTRLLSPPSPLTEKKNSRSMVSHLGWFRASKADESATQLRRRCYWYTTAHWRLGWKLSLCGHRHGGLWRCFISFSDTCLSVTRFFSVWLVSTWNTSLSLYNISLSSLLDQLAINIDPYGCHIVETTRGCMDSL